MGEVLFYHLTRSGLPATLGLLLEKSLARGWRVTVRGTDRGRLADLDQALWLGPDERFLPHGLAGGPHDSRQPILLTDGTGGNAADCLMVVDRADVTPEEAATLARVCVLFDGADGDQLAHARGLWRMLAAAGARAQYWSEESGRWELKSQSGG